MTEQNRSNQKESKIGHLNLEVPQPQYLGCLWIDNSILQKNFVIPLCCRVLITILHHCLVDVNDNVAKLRQKSLSI